MLTSVVLLRLYLRPAAPSPHGNVKFVVATPLEATLTQPPISVDSKPLTENSKSFRSNTYEKPGGGTRPPSHSPLLPPPRRPRPRRRTSGSVPARRPPASCSF